MGSITKEKYMPNSAVGDGTSSASSVGTVNVILGDHNKIRQVAHHEASPSLSPALSNVMRKAVPSFMVGGQNISLDDFVALKRQFDDYFSTASTAPHDNIMNKMMMMMATAVESKYDGRVQDMVSNVKVKEELHPRLLSREGCLVSKESKKEEYELLTQLKDYPATKDGCAEAYKDMATLFYFRKKGGHPVQVAVDVSSIVGLNNVPSIPGTIDHELIVLDKKCRERGRQKWDEAVAASEGENKPIMNMDFVVKVLRKLMKKQKWNEGVSCSLRQLSCQVEKQVYPVTVAALGCWLLTRTYNDLRNKVQRAARKQRRSCEPNFLDTMIETAQQLCNEESAVTSRINNWNNSIISTDNIEQSVKKYFQKTDVEEMKRLVDKCDSSLAALLANPNAKREKLDDFSAVFIAQGVVYATKYDYATGFRPEARVTLKYLRGVSAYVTTLLGVTHKQVEKNLLKALIEQVMLQAVVTKDGEKFSKLVTVLARKVSPLVDDDGCDNVDTILVEDVGTVVTTRGLNVSNFRC
jgi:hypothetical protein